MDEQIKNPIIKPSRGQLFIDIRNALGKALIVLIIALGIFLVLNTMMQKFLDNEVAQMQEAAKKTSAVQAAIENAENEEEKKELLYQLQLTKLEQMEAFYQQYKNRWSYHDYGQFYEVFEQVYSADTIIIGTSHATHGINPKYLDEANEGHSFYNFALNGSNPTYYVNWYDIAFEEADYPQPKNIIMCVDWFMFDDGWLWRNIFYDTTQDKPVDIMRKIEKSKPVTSNSKTNTGISDAVSAAINSTLSGNSTEQTTEDNIPIWDISAHLDKTFTVLFNKIPLIYSRDRIFEVFGSFFKTKEAEKPTEETTIAETVQSETPNKKEEKEYKLPVYKHEYLIDGSGFVTSEFYKGFIPWEAYYNGSPTGAWANDNPKQKTDFTKLIKLFQASDINLVFVLVPEYIPGRDAPQFEEKLEYLTQTAEKYNIPFLNYNESKYSDINENYQYYSDWGHLNTNGAAEFSKLLGEDLVQYLK